MFPSSAIPLRETPFTRFFRFKIPDFSEWIYSQQEKSVLSGAWRAHFEVCVHGEPLGGWLEGSGFKVQGYKFRVQRFRVQSLTKVYDIENKGKVKGNRFLAFSRDRAALLLW